MGCRERTLRVWSLIVVKTEADNSNTAKGYGSKRLVILMRLSWLLRLTFACVLKKQYLCGQKKRKTNEESCISNRCDRHDGIRGYAGDTALPRAIQAAQYREAEEEEESNHWSHRLINDTKDFLKEKWHQISHHGKNTPPKGESAHIPNEQPTDKE